MASQDVNDLVMLMEKEQLMKLATLLLNEEEPLMQRIKSQNERIKYLNDCNAAYDNIKTLLEDYNDLSKKYEGDEKKPNIAQEITDYLKYGLNMSMQVIRNCNMRVSCLEKLKSHIDSLVSELDGLGPENVSKLEDLGKEASHYKQCMWEYTDKCRSASARAKSKTYSSTIKQQGIKFQDLVNRHKNMLGYKGEFEDLEDAQKLEVYNSIIEESGRASIPKFDMVSEGESGSISMPNFNVVSKGYGVAMKMVSAGVMVWDIYTAEDKIEEVVKISLSKLSDYASFEVKVAVEAAATDALFDYELGAFFVSLAGFVAGQVAGLIFSAISGLLLDLIFGGGGMKVPTLDDIKFHTAPLPDGMALAYQISHDHN